MQVVTIGLDLAKHWFQVHGFDAAGTAILRKRLKRSEVLSFFGGIEPCLVGMEACASSHYWAREIARFGWPAAGSMDTEFSVFRPSPRTP